MKIDEFNMQEKNIEVKIDFLRTLIIGSLISSFIFINLSYLSFYYLKSSYIYIGSNIFVVICSTFLLLIIIVFLHEGIHILTYILFKGNSISEIKIKIYKLVVVDLSFVKDIPILQYRIILLTPLIILTLIIIPFCLFIYPGTLSSFALIFSLFGASFDIIYFFKLLKFDNIYMIRETETPTKILLIKTNKK